MAALKTYFNWSTGKDSALALYYLLGDKNYSIEHLLTSVNSHHNRVSMHGLQRRILELQISALEIPHSTIELPELPSMEQYEILMRRKVQHLKQQGFECAAFGDIFLEDLKLYREKQLAAFDMQPVFPLWKKDTTELLHEFLSLGFKAIVVCVSADKLDKSFAGRIIDKKFIHDLPDGIDPCGENGEFHSFCFDGPIFKNPIPFTIGATVYREYKSPNGQNDTGFWFCDLL
ncbi:MAG TPA: ATP-binding protein [Puia sp.]